MSRLVFSRSSARFGTLALVLSALILISAPAALAGPGYQPASPSSIPLHAEIPVGVAVDQSSGDIYVAEMSTDLFNFQPGEVEQLSPNGTPTAGSPFGTGGQDIFVAVAVNPLNEGIYAYQGESETPAGHKGTSELSAFSSTGALGGSFPVANSLAGTIAVDATGKVFVPSSEAGSIQAFDSSGTLTSTITCGNCPGGDFSEPAAVAFDSSGDLYVVERGGEERVIELEPSAGGYVYARTIQSEVGATAIAIDVSDDDIFVGDLASGKYHVVAYDSAGHAFDDFAAGLATQFSLVPAQGQLAVNSTTHDLYLTSPGGSQVRVLERIASIPAPTESAAAPNPVGQVTATLRASVNPKGHVLTTCEFQYTDHADFTANGYANAKVAKCPGLVGEAESVSVGASVAGLEPETSYDYRVRIASYGGSAENVNEGFETLPPLPPEASTGAVSSLTKASATLSGSVNAKGGTVSSCRFEYVTEAAFQASGFSGAPFKACTPTPSGNAASSVSAKVSGLTPATSYRFRVAVTNNSGTTQSPESSFATLAETCAENQAMCPPPPAQETPTASAPLPEPAQPVPTPTAKKPLKCRKGFKKKTVRGKAKCVKAKKRHRVR
jgi:hypothetical protein